MANRDEQNCWDTPEWRTKNVEINRMLLGLFPEVASDYRQMIVSDEWEDQGPMVVYSLVFHPLLRNALRNEPDDSALLVRIYAFLALLEEHPDRRYSEIATVEIAEFLADEHDLAERARPRLGPKMRAAIDEL